MQTVSTASNTRCRGYAVYSWVYLYAHAVYVRVCVCRVFAVCALTCEVSAISRAAALMHFIKVNERRRGPGVTAFWYLGEADAPKRSNSSRRCFNVRQEDDLHLSTFLHRSQTDLRLVRGEGVFLSCRVSEQLSGELQACIQWKKKKKCFYWLPGGNISRSSLASLNIYLPDSSNCVSLRLGWISLSFLALLRRCLSQLFLERRCLPHFVFMCSAILYLTLMSHLAAHTNVIVFFVFLRIHSVGIVLISIRLTQRAKMKQSALEIHIKIKWRLLFLRWRIQNICNT